MKDIIITSPIKGEIIPLSEVKDAVFSSGALGKGAAIDPKDGRVFAPFDGTVSALFETMHAIGLVSTDGVELLIHVGFDTVNLGGKYFTAYIAQGDTIKKGDLLLEFDQKAIVHEGYDVTTPVVVTNSDQYGNVFVKYEEDITQAEQKSVAGNVSTSSTTVNPIVATRTVTKEYTVAEQILLHIGGKENIRSVEHCATRLRLILKDKEKINEKEIEEIDGVKGQFFAAAQYQIILGTGFVNKVYEVIINGSAELRNSKHKEAAYDEMSVLQKISRTFGDVFVPIIPVLVATGLFMGIRGLITNLGFDLGKNFLLMSQILTDTAFAFLPALVAWSTMKKFGGTPVIGIVLGLMLVAPQLPNAYVVAAGGAVPIGLSLFGLDISIVGYQGSVLPALVLGIIAAKTQGALKKIVPDVLDLIVTPFLTLLISMVLGLLVVGPIMHSIEILVFGAIKTFLYLPFGIGGFVVGGLHQLIVVTGVHHAFNALEVELLATTGTNMFNAIITGAIIAQGAAALAVALKTKDKKKRSLYISSAIPAFLGITEPAIFGINLRFMKPFIYALIGGACAGMCASIFQLAGTGMGITVLPGALLYINHMVQYIIVNAVGFGVAFGLTYVLYKPQE
ncbi:MAG: system, sucrose-specific subunit [Firmicutes bacterium]|nr:system, sucrose-specific subunit [Bacillota bacterium]